MLSNVKYSISQKIVIVFVSALALQTFHMLEHLVQLHQHAILGWSIKDSSGIVGALNLEEIHWVYNLAYFVLLGIVFKDCSFFRLQDRMDGQKVAVLLFGIAFFLQGYHLVEHTVRMIQHFITGCSPCVGVLGVYVDGVYLHFILNFLVFTYPFGAFFVFGFHKKIVRLCTKISS
ncbi:hypothetical protein [Nitrosopumilus sp. b2]|uniref:hypothetical protein n=1 Tax=Nitrosopumilus sp. b2 TaxID=2109908 RepID=UPI0015F6D94B|nr:hypothetical protein [Nitrosopumilus sp. b2]KAF6245476.1 hypothetical protein C6989_03335 [Nitrosopumilus sp. b2]